MKKKIAYLTITAVIGMTAFFVGKNFSTTPTQPETVQAEETQTAPELMEMTVENGGLFLEYSNDGNFYTYWIPTEDLEKAGLINPANIVDWNTDGEELAFMTNAGYEWYAYQSENVYQNLNFIPVVEEIR